MNLRTHFKGEGEVFRGPGSINGQQFQVLIVYKEYPHY